MSVPVPQQLTDRHVQLQGSALARAVLAAAGWRVRFDGLPARQGVVIVYPHTSNWDFVVGVLAKWSIGFPLSFWGKDSLFRVPLFGRWLASLGGVPVDRSRRGGVVAPTVERLRAAKAGDEFFWLALAPEGTRRWRQHWRSGFYQVAHQADVPLGLAYFDFAEKVVGVDAFIRLSGDVRADMAAIGRHLGHRRGRRPEQAAPIALSVNEDATA